MKIPTDRAEENVREIDAVRETGTMIGITVGGVAIGIIEAGEMTPAIGLGGGETILLTRSASLDGMIAGNVLRPEIQAQGLARSVIP